MSKVFLDTNIFIYLIEDRGELGRRAMELLERLSLRRDEVLTSALTLGEVLAKPMAANDEVLADRYDELLNSPGVRVLSFDRSSARAYARIRADRTIKAPDAMQLAVAATGQCDLFVTNDERLSRKIVPGVQFIAGLSSVPV